MKPTPQDAFVLARLLGGQSVNGEMKSVSQWFRGVAEHLAVTDPGMRPGVWKAMEAAWGEDAPAIVQAVADADPNGPMPEPADAGDGTALGTDDAVYAVLSDEDLGIVPIGEIADRAVRWLWLYRLARGSLAMMAGDGGLGKSMLLLNIAAAVSNGSAWFDGEGNAPRGNVVIVSAEDRPDETIKPRLKALGADLSRITIVKAKAVIRRKDKAPAIHFASFSDLAYWKEVFRRIQPVLFIADPLPSYLGKGVNDSKNIEIRNVLEPFLDEVIAPFDVCMIGNMHLNKSIDAKTPMHRISGSIAYGNLPRNVHFVVRDPDDPDRRFFKQAKCNNAPDDLPALAFRVEARHVASDSGEPIETAVPVFEPGTIQVDLNHAVNGKGGGKRGPEPRKLLGNAEWLYDYLSTHGPTRHSELANAAGALGKVGDFDTNTRKWSRIANLYDASNFVPTLPPPRDGATVDRLKVAPEIGCQYGYTLWRLILPETGQALDPIASEPHQ